MYGGNLTRSVDPTGSMSKQDLLNLDVNNLLDAFNKGKIDFNNFNTPLIIPDANGIPNVLLGPRQINGQRGLFIAKPGINVITATDDQLIFNSLQNVFKILQVNTATIASFNVGNNTTQTQSAPTVTHNLNFVPVLVAYATASGVTSPWGSVATTDISVKPPAGGDTAIVFKTWAQGNTFITSTTLQFQLQVWNSSGGTYTTNQYDIKYYLMQESAA